MRSDELEELHYITAIENVPSVLKRGILSNRRAAKLPHRSVAMEEIQERRENVVIPGGRPLHEYANLYINARNKMMYKRKNGHADICVLRVSIDVLDLPGVVVADSNASSGYVRFAASPGGLRFINKERVFAQYWTHPDDPIDYYRHGAEMCAEVLVPDRVEPDQIIGAYVSCNQSLEALNEITNGLAISSNRHLFFY
jgi:hypothetical protein